MLASLSSCVCRVVSHVRVLLLNSLVPADELTDRGYFYMEGVKVSGVIPLQCWPRARLCPVTHSYLEAGFVSTLCCCC